MNLGSKVVILYERRMGGRTIGCVGPDPRRSFALVEQPHPHTRAFIDSSVCRRPLTDEPETPLDRDMVLIPESRDGDLDGRLGRNRSMFRPAECLQRQRCSSLPS